MANSDLQTWNSGTSKYLGHANEENDLFKHLIDSPAFIQLCSPVKGKRVLDIGCGNGDFVNLLSKEGAFAVGLDGAANMIDEAKRKYPSHEFITFDLLNTDDLPYPTEHFDIVTSKMMLMNLSPLEAVGKRVMELLKPGGYFAIDVLHPFRPILKNATSTTTNYANDFNYFEETKGSIEFSGSHYSFYYRPIHQYLNDFTKLGFKFIKMQEPYIDEEFAKKHSNEQRVKTPISLHILFKK